MKITVVIPAFNRPALLDTALRSVAKQTAVGMIDKVIVSENGLNKESKAVCDAFNDIRVEYIYQETQLPVSKHMQWIMSLEQENYVAFLCDDDWWDINHLELAIRHLRENRDCHAYFSNFLYSYDEHSIKLGLYTGVKAIHFGKQNYSNYYPCVYTMNDLFNYSFMITPFHFSSVVCRGDILTKAVKIFDRTHPTYADRVLWTVIGSLTNVVFNPLSTTLIRLHDEMDSHKYSSLEWKSEMQLGSLLVLELANEQGYDLKNAINQLYSKSQVSDAEFLLDRISDVFHDRKHITWFDGYDKIVKQDLIENSYKYRAKKLAVRAVKGLSRRLF